MEFDKSHANGGGQIAVAAPITAGYCKGAGVNDGRKGAPQNLLLSDMAVRRLTPRECERLQGFPDDFTLVPYGKKLMADGPRYRMLGNAMAVPVIGWILERIDMVDVHCTRVAA